MTTDETDKKLLGNSTFNMLTKEPFKEIADKLGLNQNEIISRLENLRQAGAIRRIGAKINPKDVCLPANAMVAWKIPSNRIQEVGEFFSGFKEVTHCYERETVPGKWDYNIYTVLHSRNRAHIKTFVKQLSKNLGTPEYIILFSKKNLKTSEPYKPDITKTLRKQNQHRKESEKT